MAYGIYMHLPYCTSRCHYCDFHSAPLTGRAGAGPAVPGEYLRALVDALGALAPTDEKGRPLRPATLYFGGGTPSLLTPAQLETLVDAAGPAPGAEITLEANPASLLPARLQDFRKAGVNRLSLGVQSARDASLALLGRPHTVHEARQALEAAHRAGIENISGDIMLGLPGYTTDEFDETLALLQQGGAHHISAYLLKIEEGTPFGASPPPGLPPPDAAADFYLYACAALEEAGYPQYEISNFARPGCESCHNLLYWNGEDYLGLGPSAHSSLFGRRFSFPLHTGAFIRGESPPREEGPFTAQDYIMLQLRLAAGLDENVLEARFSTTLSPEQKNLFSSLEQTGLARTGQGHYVLTPRGMLVQNQILARLLA